MKSPTPAGSTSSSRPQPDSLHGSSEQANLQRHTQWHLREDTTYLNHGSFGPPPKPVQEAQRLWKTQLDEQPMDFYVRRLEPAWREAQGRLAEFVGVQSNQIAFVENATYGMNVVANSLALKSGDEILLNDHEYGAVRRIWERAAKDVGASVVDAKLPWPIESAEQIVDAIASRFTPRTRLAIVSHVTSPTAVNMPVAAICKRAREAGIPVCVDGPHAPAYLPLHIAQLDCDFYVASCHKWLSAPLGSGFVFVSDRFQPQIKAPILSWGRLLPSLPELWYEELLWSGTRDPSAYLSVPNAIDFLRHVGLDHFRETTHALARVARHQIVELTGLAPMVPDDLAWYGSMAHVPLPPGDHQVLQQSLWNQHRIEVPVIRFNEGRYIRVSCHLYNSQRDIDYLLNALRTQLAQES
ncbi:MAG: Isopenicillin epimerase [Planctomycetota bacterium]